MIFRFVVQRLHFLAAIPGLPAIFDALLLIHTCIFRRRVAAAISSLEAQAVASYGIELSRHRYGGTAFRQNGRELAHVHGNGLFDAALSQVARDEVVRSGRAEPHHVFPNSRWISLWIRSESDVAVALDLLHRSAER